MKTAYRRQSDRLPEWWWLSQCVRRFSSTKMILFAYILCPRTELWKWHRWMWQRHLSKWWRMSHAEQLQRTLLWVSRGVDGGPMWNKAWKMPSWVSSSGILQESPAVADKPARRPLAKSSHGLRKSSGVVSCIARLPIDSLPMVSYYVLYSNCL